MKKLAIIVVILAGLLLAAPASAATTNRAADTTTATVLTGKMYGIGSVSKVFTAAAVMKLVDDGKLDLDESIVTYMPEFSMADERHTQITARMLLNHSSGLMGMTDNNAWQNGTSETLYHDNFISNLKTQRLKHNPGERSIYSNDSFTFAEILVEEVSGISFTDFIEQNFADKMGLENVKTPQSDFDREKLASTYLGDAELLPESLGVIGSGGIYSSMDDLAHFSTIFMRGYDGSVLSKASADEMAKNQHKMSIVDENADATLTYGLGWDSVNVYPFNTYGIKALAKGGATGVYHTNLTVLPEYNLAAAVSSSGSDANEAAIAQEIILAVLAEEGLIEEKPLTMPEYSLEKANIPEEIKAYAGLYDAGGGNLLQAEFSDDTLILTPIGTRNDRSQLYIYNKNGEFISTNGDYMLMGFQTTGGGKHGETVLKFVDNEFIVIQTYEDIAEISQIANAMPIAQKVEPNQIPSEVQKIWDARASKDYLLVNEKYNSFQYVGSPIARIGTNEKSAGYVGEGIYQGSGKLIKNAKIIDENTAQGFQTTPTMAGRDINDITFSKRNGIDFMNVNGYKYIDAATIKRTSEIKDNIKVDSEAVWLGVDEQSSGAAWKIEIPAYGSWFVYDDKMNCVATSLVKAPQSIVILPENGRIAFVGESGSEFVIKGM